MIRMWIKGNIEEAKQAASARGIPILTFRQVKAQTICETRPFFGDLVVQWFHEQTEATKGKGFPPGTLLLWSNLDLGTGWDGNQPVLGG
jgi:hypothetical protein